MLAWKLIPVVPQVLIRHGQVGGPHAGRVRGWRGASSDERHVLVAWVPAPNSAAWFMYSETGALEMVWAGCRLPWLPRPLL